MAKDRARVSGQVVLRSGQRILIEEVIEDPDDYTFPSPEALAKASIWPEDVVRVRLLNEVGVP